MLNGLLTLRGAWDKVRTDPVLKFFAAGVTFYGMATFEGPLLSIKSVNGLAHYTDWIIGHVHAGALGWNGFMAAGMFYWLVPRLYGTQALLDASSPTSHFWIGTVRHPPLRRRDVGERHHAGPDVARDRRRRARSCTRTSSRRCIAIRPMYWMRLVGGVALPRRHAHDGLQPRRAPRAPARRSTASDRGRRRAVEAPRRALGRDRLRQAGRPRHGRRRASSAAIGGRRTTMASIVLRRDRRRRRASSARIALQLDARTRTQPAWHRLLEGRALLFTVARRSSPCSSAASPSSSRRSSSSRRRAALATRAPYTRARARGPRHLRARGLLHLPLADDPTVRASRRSATASPRRSATRSLRPPVPVGLEAHRPGPRARGRQVPEPLALPAPASTRASISPGSNMPPYALLASAARRLSTRPTRKLRAMQQLGVPYTDAEDVDAAAAAAQAQAGRDRRRPRKAAASTSPPTREIVALIAYLQRLGKLAPPPDDSPAPRPPWRSSEANHERRSSRSCFANSPLLWAPVVASLFIFTVVFALAACCAWSAAAAPRAYDDRRRAFHLEDDHE